MFPEPADLVIFWFVGEGASASSWMSSRTVVCVGANYGRFTFSVAVAIRAPQPSTDSSQERILQPPNPQIKVLAGGNALKAEWLVSR